VLGLVGRDKSVLQKISDPEREDLEQKKSVLVGGGGGWGGFLCVTSDEIKGGEVPRFDKSSLQRKRDG